MKRNRKQHSNERSLLNVPPRSDKENNRTTTKLKDSLQSGWPIALSVLALIISILSAIPSYLSYLEGRPFLYTFKCEKIEYQSKAKIRNGPPYFDYAEIETNCDFRNIGSRPISLMKIEQVGINKSSNIKVNFGTSDTINPKTPKTLEPGEALLFDEVFLIPIKKNWDRAHKVCERVSNDAASTVIDLLNCLGDIDDFHRHLQDINFPGPAAGTFVFNRFAIQVDLVNGTQILEDVELARELKNTPFRTH